MLALRAREHDRRFFRRDVRADVRVLESVPLEEGETGLPKKLAEELSHLGEIGSLLVPTDEDMDAIRAELASRAGDLFAAATKDGLEGALETCEALRRRFDVVVANPPYMGSSSFNPFMSGWVKKNYSDVKSDLCTCFIERGHSLAAARGYAAMVTMQSWMFLGSFEKMRGKLIAEKGIITMAHLGPRAFDAIGGEVVSVTADVLYNDKFEGSGAYFRLVDINGSEPKRQALLEAIKNPTCGWFYRRDASTFHQIPGSPIAYWASEGLLSAFSEGQPIRNYFIATVKGIFTGDNARFLRHWHEIDSSSINNAWRPYAKGGPFRKWYGNIEYVVNWQDDATELRSFEGSGLSASRYFGSPTYTWSKISSSYAAFRRNDGSVFFDDASPAFVFAPNEELGKCRYLAFANSSISAAALSLIAPTLNYQTGDVGNLPVLDMEPEANSINRLTESSIAISKRDYDSFETSWDFKRSPLL